MDADMAIQLSRARRETVSSPITQNTPPMSQPAVSPIVPFSPHEQREIDIARGHVTSEGLILQDHIDDSAAHMDHSQTDSSTIDFRSHLSQNHDPNLLATSHLPPNHELHSGGLPAYQATSNVSQFDFSMMEAYAADEKTRLGVSPRFVLSPPHRPRPDPTSESAVDDQPEASEPGPSDRTRQRKLSQSAPVPRPSRKGIGAKLALFESHANEPLPARIGMLLGQSSANNDSEPSLNAPAPNYYQTGHDRPYRFSFYSNALSATIHSRSLSELPFEGQTFEQLFAGIGGSTGTTPHPGNPNGGSNVNNNGPSRAGTRDGAGRPESILKRPGATSDDYFMPGTPKAGTPGLPATKDADAGTWWLDVTSPTDEEMKMLSKVFNIHPLTTEDIQMEETREKIELFRNYYFVCFRSFDQDQYSPTYLEPLNMYIIVFREGILSFHFQATPHPQNVRRRIKHLKDYISVTSDWISYALIDDITDAFGPLIQSIEYEVDSIDDLVLIIKDAEQTDMLRRIGTCRKKVMGLLRLMGNKADVVKGLAKRCNENWRVAPTSDIGLYLSDIQDHLITMTQNLNHYEKILSRSHSNYLAQISIEMTDANNQINDVLTKLTALGTVLIPMNLVTGLWGMNVHVPGEGVESFTWFISIIAGLATFALIGGYSTYKLMVK